MKSKLADLIKTITNLSSKKISDTDYFNKIFNQLLGFLKCSEFKERNIDKKLEEVINDIKDLQMLRQTWKDFLEKQKKIVIISLGKDEIENGTYIIDMMLSSLHSFKANNSESHFTVIIDEVQDQNLTSTSPLNAMIRKSRKNKIGLIMASQEYIDKIGEPVGNNGTNVFFSPTNVIQVAKVINDIEFNNEILSSLAVHECVIVGNIYNKIENRNCRTKIKGKTYEFVTHLSNKESKQEKQNKYNGFNRFKMRKELNNTENFKDNNDK